MTIRMKQTRQVSIHVPLAEHDSALNFNTIVYRGFNSRAPRGARPVLNLAPVAVVVSIHVPLAEHDLIDGRGSSRAGVSIHVPLAEHDVRLRHGRRYPYSFNSRAPRGARHLNQDL